MITFTAGPWRVGDAGHTVFGPPNGNPSPETICHTQKISNARLMAAAPELLEALQLMQAALTEYGLRDAKKRFSLCVADAAASKAIHKATA